uniref:BTB domain-containing protein n=1 Tax=Aegilops tauschii subsp. strangulata TaxID=200361 RepID=A0A453EM94_AEGTS
ILAARSPVFKAELVGPMKENKMRCVHIEDMDADVFGALLHFIYTDELPVTTRKEETAMAQHLLVAADRYDMERLKLVCQDKLCRHLGGHRGDDPGIGRAAPVPTAQGGRLCVPLQLACQLESGLSERWLRASDYELPLHYQGACGQARSNPLDLYERSSRSSFALRVCFVVGSCLCSLAKFLHKSWPVIFMLMFRRKSHRLYGEITS